MSMSSILDTLMRSQQQNTSSAPPAPAQPEQSSNPLGFIGKLKEALPIKVGIGFGPMAASFNGGSNNDALLRKLLERQMAGGAAGSGGVTTNPQPSSPVYKYEPLKLSPMQGLGTPMPVDPFNMNLPRY